MKMKRILGILFCLALVLGLMPGMSRTALAATETYTKLMNDKTVVKFNNYNWYIIADNSTSATAGTVTLLAADTSFGKSVFNFTDSNDYSSSTVKRYLDSFTAEGGSFAGVKDAIADTDLTDVNVTGAKLFLLSTSEANQEDIKNFNFTGAEYGGWWLRSPGSLHHSCGTCVYGAYRYLDVSGHFVIMEFGVRPALQLNLESVIFESESNTFSLKPSHTHSFAYTADGATITATCTADGCTLPPSSEGGSDHVARLTIAAPALATYGEKGKNAAASLTGLSGFNAATGKTIAATEIRYVGRDGTTCAESATAPTDAGKYAAKITVEEKTASVDYEIAKADPTVTTPSATATYGQTLADVGLTNPEGNTEGTWAFADAGTTSVGNVGNNTFKTNFTPTDTANYNSKENIDVSVTVGKADNPLIYAETQNVNKTFSAASQTGTLAAAANAEGTLSYKIISQKNASNGHVAFFTLNETILTIAADTPAGTYTVVVRATAAGNGNYNSGTKESTVTVTVDKAALTVTAPTAKTLTYSGKAQPLVTAGKATGGTVQYALGTATEATQPYTTSIPTATNAGTYYVWYKVVGDENHTDTTPVSLTVG